MVSNFLKITFRNLRKNRSYSLLNIFGLAIGITCAGLIFLWVEDELAFDSNHLKKDRVYLVEVNENNSTGILSHSSTPGPLAAALPGMLPGVVDVCRTSDASTV